MARIRQDDHARILQLVDVERHAVREIAAEFGCTPATIYGLLKKLRRQDSVLGTEPGESQPPLALGEEMEAEILIAPASGPSVPPAAPATTTAIVEPEAERRVLSFERAAPAAAAAAAAAPRREEARRPAPAVGGKLAKPGMGLLMRTAEGEETMTPFRSIDDLLSAIKPILRAGARSPEPVWFSLQPVDLATIDVDAA
jgi:transposase